MNLRINVTLLIFTVFVGSLFVDRTEAEGGCDVSESAGSCAPGSVLIGNACVPSDCVGTGRAFNPCHAGATCGGHVDIDRCCIHIALLSWRMCSRDSSVTCLVDSEPSPTYHVTLIPGQDPPQMGWHREWPSKAAMGYSFEWVKEGVRVPVDHMASVLFRFEDGLEPQMLEFYELEESVQNDGSVVTRCSPTKSISSTAFTQVIHGDYLVLVDTNTEGPNACYGIRARLGDKDLVLDPKIYNKTPEGTAVPFLIRRP